jgi:DNA-binding NarL/FixJ family response regulator
VVRILLADHHANALWGLKTLIQEEPELEVVGEAMDVESLNNLSARFHPDLILMDKDLPGIPIANLMVALHRLIPRPIVIVMSSDPESSRMMLKAGADAFVSKGDQPDWLLQILRDYKKRTMNKKDQIRNNTT